jgi:hypothetical protein
VAVHIAIKTNATTAKKRKRFLLLKSIELAEAAGVTSDARVTDILSHREAHVITPEKLPQVVAEVRHAVAPVNSC